MSLRQKAASGLLWTSLADIGQRVFSFAILLILARLLSVEAFGTVALAAAFITFASVPAQGGLSSVIIQRSTLTAEDKNTAFFTSILLGAGVTLLGLAVAGPLAALFDTPTLKPVLQLLSPIFLLQSLANVPGALLVRELGFRALALRSLVATLLSGMTAVGLAWHGWGVYSLVAQQLMQAAISLVMVWSLCRWKPGRAVSRVAGVHMLSLGTRFMAAQLVGSLNQTVYLFAVGFVLGTEAAGLFRLAWTGLDLCIQIAIKSFTTVAFPIFSRLQNDRARLAETFIEVTRHCAALTFPLFLGGAVLAPELVVIAFGAKWTAAGEVVRVLCLVVLPATTNFFIPPVLSALGRPEDTLILSLAQIVLATVLAVLAAPFGVVAVAAAHVLRACLTTPLGFWLLRRQMPLDLGQTARNLLPPLTAALAMAGLVLAAEQAIGPGPSPILVLTALVPFGVLSYLCILLLLDRRLVTDAFQIARGVLLSSRKSYP